MISILAPSRDRPLGLFRMIESSRATARSPIEIVCRIDDDEPQAEAYHAMHVSGTIDKLLVGPRIVMSDMWNVCMRAASGDILMLASDDVVMRTPGWTQAVEDAFAASADKLLLVHGDDLAKDGKWFPTFPIIHRRWVEAVGRFTAPYFSSDYADTWLYEVAKSVGRLRFLPYVTEHMHWAFQKAAVDRTMSENIARRNRDNPGQTFKKLTAERDREVAVLRALMIQPRWSILVLTQPSRAEFLQRLMACLKPQIDAHLEVELFIRYFDNALSLGDNRQRMAEAAEGEYQCIVDDDDLVAPDYVARILPLLDGVDQISFRLQQFTNGARHIPTYISLRHGRWYNTDTAEYRDIMQVCPLRRELSLAVPREGGPGEDARWAAHLRNMGIVKTEHVIDEVMYFYYLRTGKTDSPGTIGAPPWIPYNQRRPEPAMRQPGVPIRASHCCPRCGSSCVVPSNAQLICNQCLYQGAPA